ncbi:MAG: hypothetical protein ABR929_10780, partial [Roseiarcus sp.]
ATRSYRRIAGDHRKPLARYGATKSALRERLAPAELHHSRGHDQNTKYLPVYVAEFQFRYNNRLNADIFEAAIKEC